MGEAWIVRNKQEAEAFCRFVMENMNKDICYEIQRPTRTSAQNRAIWAYCQEVAIKLKEAGYDMRHVIRQDIPIEPTKNIVKEQIWSSVQKAMFGEESTRKLKPNEVNEVYQIVARTLAERFDINVPFGRE